jgi:hypothetical protein
MKLLDMNKRQGSIFWSENDIFHHLPKTIFSPSRDTSFFDSYHALFALIEPYFD